MKNIKKKKLLKSVRKTISENIKQSLVTQFREENDKVGPKSKKIEKKIEKGSRQLAKKLFRQLKIKNVALLKTGNNAETQV